MNKSTSDITIDEARENLETWLDIAAHSSIWSEYDERCSQAHTLLGRDEYGEIWQRWASG